MGNDSVTEKGIDFNNLNYPYKKSKLKIGSIKGKQLQQDADGKFIKYCQKCHERFTVPNRGSIRKTCDDCSYYQKTCRACGADFVSRFKFSAYCSNPECAKLGSKPHAIQFRSLIKIFTKEYGFTSQDEAVTIAFRYYIKNRKDAERVREEYRNSLQLKKEEEKRKREEEKKEEMIKHGNSY
jgi:hypothetical protein